MKGREFLVASNIGTRSRGQQERAGGGDVSVLGRQQEHMWAVREAGDQQ